MGFPPGATVSTTDVWTGADAGDVSGAWEGVVDAPGGDWRIFTFKSAAAPGAGFSLSSATASALAASAAERRDLGMPATPAARAANKTLVVPLATPPLAISGLAPPARGIFDPSLATSGDASTPFLMSLSTVEATDNISTIIAGFDAARGEWALLARVNAANFSDALPCAGGEPCEGSVVREVSSLVVDEADPDPSRRLKVFAHSYIVTNGTELHYDWAHISLYTAPAPAGPWSDEQPLLGWRGASPFSTAGVRQVLTDFAPLADCLIFTEPGALALGGARPLLLLALGCASAPAQPGDVAPIRVVLVASADFGATWAYVSELVGAADAASLGSEVPQTDAADLFVAPDASGALAIFLSVSPSRLLWPGFVGYAGCAVLRLAANASGVMRDAAGHPIVERAIEPDGLAFSGACTAASVGEPAGAGSAGGYMLPAIIPVPPADFRILASGSAPL
jgi:hypothetical protein